MLHSLFQSHWVDLDHEISTKGTPCREVAEEEAAWGSGGLLQCQSEPPLEAVACKRKKPLDRSERSR